MSRRNSRNYSVVPYIFDDEGRRQRRFVRVQKGCRFLPEVQFYYDNGKLPDTFKGHKIVGWVYVYSADSQWNDKYSPIISLKKEDPLLSFFSGIFRFIFGGKTTLRFTSPKPSFRSRRRIWKRPRRFKRFR